MAAAYKPCVSSPGSLEAPSLNPEEQVCLEQVHEVLMGSKKPSTRATYLAKMEAVLHLVFPKTSPAPVVIPTTHSRPPASAKTTRSSPFLSQGPLSSYLGLPSHDRQSFCLFTQHSCPVSQRSRNGVPPGKGFHPYMGPKPCPVKTHRTLV